MRRTPYSQLLQQLVREPATWLVTGAAGFIGSNLVETLLRAGQRVVGLDNFATGHQRNLAEVRDLLKDACRKRFRFIEGDITDAATCRKACRKVDFVLHQAALGSVPRSIERPLESHASNVTGFLNMLAAARDAKARRFVYASSSAIYGDHPDLPKREERIGTALSPYAVTKHTNELYASVFEKCYGIQTVGLRYFNVFGPRQDPDGPYAAVIPRWIAAMLANRPVQINGDGETSRDFCYVANAVQANLLAATSPRRGVTGRAYNVALNEQTTLNELFELLRTRLAPLNPALESFQPHYARFRAGDVRHSRADITQARRWLGYVPTHRLSDGLDEALEWYCQNARKPLR
jgi:UDP-N-acetylglucosamine 4-epimerase